MYERLCIDAWYLPPPCVSPPKVCSPLCMSSLVDLVPLYLDHRTLYCQGLCGAGIAVSGTLMSVVVSCTVSCVMSDVVSGTVSGVMSVVVSGTVSGAVSGVMSVAVSDVMPVVMFCNGPYQNIVYM